MSTQDMAQETLGEGEEVLEPIEQAIIPFYGRELLAVRLADGRIAAALSWLCEGLGLDPKAQARRIKRTKAIAGELLPVRLDTPGGRQTGQALTIKALPFWLARLDPGRFSPELEPVILAYQLECVDVLYRHFAERPRELTAPRELVSSEAIERPERPAQEASAIAWAEYHEAMAAWLRWQADISAWRQGVDDWRGAIEDRLETIEEVTRLVPEILSRLGPETLSPERQGSVRAAVKHLHDVSGLAFSTIYADLAAAFHVARYADIREAEWPQVSEWFSIRIAAAERGRH